jgi:site-specific DNA-methyltransferase (adenine-specific)
MEENYNNKILQGNVLEVLRKLPDNFVDMMITSPPYWALRNYGLPDSIFGGDITCKHVWQEENHFLHRGSSKSKKLTEGTVNEVEVLSNTCSKCGAWKGQLGQEPNYHDYINHLFEIMQEVSRVVKDSGSIWVNLGDSYAGSNQGSGTEKVGAKQKTNRGTNYMNSKDHKSILAKIDIRQKSLVGIPDRFKIQMIDGGFICRNEIIWHKPNQMPVSTKDRFTVDFEKFYFFTNNGKYYFEQQLEESVWAKLDSRAETGATLGEKGSKKQYALNESGKYRKDKKRNKRSVWSINTKGLREAHFAIFPEELIETPIKACCPENGLVMDIFFGSGTTGVVAKKLNRNYLGIELNTEYIKIAEKRLDFVQ